jgi:hypothetical protein
VLLAKLGPWEAIRTRGRKKEYGEEELIRNCSNYKDLDIAADVKQRLWNGEDIQ